MFKKLFQIIFPCKFNEASCKDSLFGCSCGKGDDQPDAPTYQEDPTTTKLKNKIGTQITGLLDTPYEDYVSRFTPSEGTQNLLSEGITRQQGLLDETDYGLENYDEIEQGYLDTILKQYTGAREEAYKPMQESLIAENLFGSGPGYGIQSEFAEETGEGAADITAQWAREGINRRFQQKSYNDALKRGDYSTMYNLALSQANQDVAPHQQATQTQGANLGAGMGFFGNLQSADLQKYGLEQQAHQTALENYYAGQSNLGGLGMGLGALGGLALNSVIPGGGLAAAAIGSSVGGGLGSMFKY